METSPNALIDHASPSRWILFGLLLLSAAGLTFEINLTRLFSISQFYHFAFMIVSIALLGYGTSGTVLAIFPRIGRSRIGSSLGWLALATTLSILGAYLLINELPFDSFSIAWDKKQIWILSLHYIVLASPFFFSGMAAGLLISSYPLRSGWIYAINLLGSAIGCLLALLAPSALGGEGTVVLSSGMASIAAIVVLIEARTTLSRNDSNIQNKRLSDQRIFLPLVVSLLLFIQIIVLVFSATGIRKIRWLNLHLSPYKSLSYALQVPGAELVSQQWNSYSRVDVIRSPAIHSFPGLSYRYMKALPVTDGLTVDGDDLMPIIDPTSDLEFTDYLPTTFPFKLRPQAKTLVLEPRAGLDIEVALAQGARRVTAVEMNPLIVNSIGGIYQDPHLRLEIESDRSFLRRTSERFDIIVLSLVNSYHPVRSGAFSLMEDYRYTVEAFQDALACLTPDGLLVVTRWLQTPPSESLRTFALFITAIESSGGDPGEQLVALRGFNTATILAKNGQFTADEIRKIKEFSNERAFDLIYTPDINPDETNRYNILPEPVYYQAFTTLLETQPRAEFYKSYPFDIKPPTDDHPFFGHFFKWSQAGQILQEIGKTWQPFGGAGYFVVIVLLLFVVIMAGILIILPAIALNRVFHRPFVYIPLHPLYLVYFGLIGFAFMLVEIPLIQRFILYLDQPAYAITAVLFNLLFFSAFGSRLSSRIPLKPAIGLLVVLLLAMPWLLSVTFHQTLGLSLPGRLAITAIVVAPVGFLMGVPFPGGIQLIFTGTGGPSEIPMIWATNGAASVVSSVLAALLALSFSLSAVFFVGALCYAGAWLVLMAKVKSGSVSLLPR